MAKILITVGVVLIVFGAAYHYFPGLFSWFGHMPGDFRIERESGSFHFPLVSMIIISVVLTVLLNLFLRR